MLAYWDRDTWLPFCRWHIQTYSPKWELSNFIQIPLQFSQCFDQQHAGLENGLAAIEDATSYTLLWVTRPRGFKYTCMNISWYDTSNFSPFDFSQDSYLKNEFEFPIKKLLRFVSWDLIDRKSVLVEAMAWCLTGDKPLHEPTMTKRLTLDSHGYYETITYPEWGEMIYYNLTKRNYKLAK